MLWQEFSERPFPEFREVQLKFGLFSLFIVREAMRNSSEAGLA
jgi:hypothetical protein